MTEEQTLTTRLVADLWDQYEDALVSIINTISDGGNETMMIMRLASKLVGFAELLKGGHRVLTGMEKKNVVVQLGSKALHEALDMSVERNQTIVTLYDDYVDESIEMLITLSRNVNVGEIAESISSCLPCFKK